MTSTSEKWKLLRVNANKYIPKSNTKDAFNIPKKSRCFIFPFEKIPQILTALRTNMDAGAIEDNLFSFYSFT